jgi:hypothetical protein
VKSPRESTLQPSKRDSTPGQVSAPDAAQQPASITQTDFVVETDDNQPSDGAQVLTILFCLVTVGLPGKRDSDTDQSRDEKRARVRNVRLPIDGLWLTN